MHTFRHKLTHPRGIAGMAPAIAPGSVMAWESAPEMWVNEAGWPQCSQGLWQEADYHAELVTLSLRPPQDDGDAVQSAVLCRRRKVKWETCIRFALNASPQNILENTCWVSPFSFICQPFFNAIEINKAAKGKHKIFPTILSIRIQVFCSQTNALWLKDFKDLPSVCPIFPTAWLDKTKCILTMTWTCILGWVFPPVWNVEGYIKCFRSEFCGQ